MNSYQPAIVPAVPEQAVYLTFVLRRNSSLQLVIDMLQKIDLQNDVIGIAQSLLDQFNRSTPELRNVPEFGSTHIDLASTQSDLWIWLRGNNQGELLHRSRYITRELSPVFDLTTSVNAFRYTEGRDLTGYEDGTENPEAEAAIDAAIYNGDNQSINGSSFVAVQQWLHNFETFESFDREHQDNIIGRRRSDNEELDEAPESAHVKRTAQESFNPEAFLLRRSMPWSSDLQGGLVFVAFGHSFAAFEAQINRMLGNDDDIEDALFEFSRVLNSAYYWCPPVDQGYLNLTAIDQQPES